jgi:mono/diheme cytochrome c family protein
MKSKVTVIFLIMVGIAALAWAAGDAANGKALFAAHKCAVCHKEGSKTGKPIPAIASGSDARIKGAITNPKGTLGPDVKMPAVKLSDAQLNDIIAYIRSCK